MRPLPGATNLLLLKATSTIHSPAEQLVGVEVQHGGGGLVGLEDGGVAHVAREHHADVRRLLEHLAHEAQGLDLLG